VLTAPVLGNVDSTSVSSTNLQCSSITANDAAPPAPLRSAVLQSVLLQSGLLHSAPPERVRATTTNWSAADDGPTADYGPIAGFGFVDSRRSTMSTDAHSNTVVSSGGNNGSNCSETSKKKSSNNTSVDSSTARALKRTVSAMDPKAVKRARNERARNERASVELETLEEIRSLVECDLSGDEIAPVLQRVADTLDEYHNKSALKASSSKKSSAKKSWAKQSSARESSSKNSASKKSSAREQFDSAGDDGCSGGDDDCSSSSGGGDDGDSSSVLHVIRTVSEQRRRLTLFTSKDALAVDINKRRRDLEPACVCKGGRHVADCANLWMAYSKATIADLERVRAGAPAMKHLLAALDQLAQEALQHVPRLRLFVSPIPQTHIPIEDRKRRSAFLIALENEPNGFVAACVVEWQQGRAVGLERDNDEDKQYVKAVLQPDDEDAVSRLRNAATHVIEQFNSGRISEEKCRAALIDALVVDNCLVRAFRLGAHGKRAAAIRLVAAMGEVVSALCGGFYDC
jgi:hypothetical protein